VLDGARLVPVVAVAADAGDDQQPGRAFAAVAGERGGRLAAGAIEHVLGVGGRAASTIRCA